MKFTILVYWCQMNYADSARIKAVLENMGFEYTKNIDDADIVIFDTCSVRQKSEDKIFGKLKQIPKDKKVWLTGCMVQHDLLWLTKVDSALVKAYTRWNFAPVAKDKLPLIVGFDPQKDKEEFWKNPRDVVYVNASFQPLWDKLKSKFDNVELLFRIDDLPYLPLMLQRLGYDVTYSGEIVDEYTSLLPWDANQLLDTRLPVAYIPIQTWCSQFCAYCIVPFARGLEKNRPWDEVVREAKHYLDQGYKEIVLLGQIVNKHPDFVKIIREILKLPGLKWLRYTSPYPTFYSDELLALHEQEAKLTPHIHAPVQSGSDAVLKKMFRGYTVDQYKRFVDKVRSLKRDISLTTDIIVGFSYETDEDFAGTLELAEYARFDMIYIGIYSPRPGTIGARKYEDDVPAEVKKQRWQALNDLLQRISLENNQAEVGKVYDVLVKNVGENAVGYNEKLKTVIFPLKERVKVGDFVKVKITKPDSLKIWGEIVGE